MSDSPRDELLTLARALAAHVEWQRELGASALPRGLAGSLGPSAPPVASAPVAPRPAAVASPAPRPRQAAPVDEARVEPSAPTVDFELPAFLKRGRPGASRPAPGSIAPAEPPAAALAPAPPPAASFEPPREPEPVAAPPAATPPAVRALFAEPAPSIAAAMTGPPVEGEARVRALDVIRDQVAGCTSCRLHEQRKQTVFARGNPFAPLAFVGEGPGRDEDLQGAPFVGAAGQLLDKIIGAMGLTEQDVYICNVVKCRPPNNRVPMPDEMGACGPFLVSQLGLVRPQIIVALGKTAVGYLLGSTDSMSRLRGRWHAWNGIPLLPTWHPAYLLRQPSAKKDTWDDMKLVLQRMGKSLPRR